MLTYRDYRNDPIIGVDIETKDPFLVEKGPGVYRKDGRVLGVALSNGDIAEYYPIAHDDLGAEEQAKNRRYVGEQLKAGNAKAFANGLYDLDWLVNGEGMEVRGRYEDVQVAEPLLNEYKRSYSLDSLAKERLGLEKRTDVLRRYCDANGVEYGRDPRSAIWRLPSSIVEEYAAEDPLLTVKVLAAQKAELKEQGLEGVYDLEMRLWPMLLRMRRQGVRIDRERLNGTGEELTGLARRLQEELDEIAKRSINPGSGKDLEALFRAKGLPVSRKPPTELMREKGKTEGNPCFDKDTLAGMDHPLAKKILRLRHARTLLSLFVGPYPELMVDGRLHCQFHQLRGDEYGTVSGRFSSSNPNLQQVSAKNEEELLGEEAKALSGLAIRRLFVPEDSCDWAKLDWSQIEYRLIAHYAIGEGSDRIRQRYREDPTTDYHEELGRMTGIADRKTVKNLNFAGAYGIGVATMARKFRWAPEEARRVYGMYHDRAPFVKETMNRVALKAKRFGYIRTILERRCRMPSPDKGYVMLNRLIQGSAADLMKKAMADSWEAGVFNVLYPHLTVHDELDVSRPRTKEGHEALMELKHIMEHCIELRVPIVADMEIGPSWGELEKVK